jgi:hypothetical protein
MTIDLNAQRLVGLGFRGLTREQTNTLLEEMYKAGEEIVGLKLASRMSDKQLDEFNRLYDSGDEEAAFNWLKTNFPEYRKVADSTFEELDEALRRAAREIHGDDLDSPDEAKA